MKKLTIFLYGIFLLIFSVFTYLFVDPNLSYFKNVYTDFFFSNRLISTIFYAISIVIFFVFYASFVYWGVKRRLSLKDILILLSITSVVLFFSYPAMLSHDIFNYIATSKVLFFYRENPYVVMPIEFIGDPLLAFTHAANKIALYGPFWILLTGIPYFFGFGNFIAILFGLKLLNILFYLGTVFLIWKISKNIMTLVLFSLNPLVIMETLMSGHNDIVMIFLVLFSFFLLMRKKILLGILFFALSVLIKYATIFLIPVFVFMLWRTVKKKQIDTEKIFYYASLLMYIGFFLSPIREEIYPWYAIWFISLISFIPNKKILLYTSIAFSFSLLLRYIPFMIAGVYTAPVPLIKEIITFIPLILVFIYYGVKKKI